MSYELYQGSREGDSDGSRDERMRTFLVDAPPDAAFLDPIVPAVGSAYPGGNPNVPDIFKLKVDRRSVRKIGTGDKSLVFVYYTSSRLGRLSPKPDTTHPNFQSWSIDYEVVTVDIPTVLTFPLKVPNAPGAPAQNETGYESTTFEVKETQTKIMRRISLPQISTGDVANIGSQNNTIHKINGRLYLFEVGGIHQTETSTWEVSYSWTEDLGTRKPFSFLGQPWPLEPLGGGQTVGVPVTVGSPRINYPPGAHLNFWNSQGVGLNDSAFYIRSPYCAVSHFRGEDGIPYFKEVSAYIAPNGGLGWQTLPGDLGF